MYVDQSIFCDNKLPIIIKLNQYPETTILKNVLKLSQFKNACTIYQN